MEEPNIWGETMGKKLVMPPGSLKNTFYPVYERFLMAMKWVNRWKSLFLKQTYLIMSCRILRILEICPSFRRVQHDGGFRHSRSDSKSCIETWGGVSFLNLSDQGRIPGHRSKFKSNSDTDVNQTLWKNHPTGRF